jgi:hypothetical protein
MAEFTKVYYSGWQGRIIGEYNILDPAQLIEIPRDELLNTNPRGIRLANPGLISELSYRVIEEEYKKRGKFGPFGDVVGTTWIRHERNHGLIIMIVDFVGRKAFHKPGLAADLLPFIRDRTGKVFFIGIIRRGSPGEGKPALLGGFLNINGFHLETPAEALLHEGREEIGLHIYSDSEDLERLENAPLADDLKVKVILGKGRQIFSQLKLVGVFPTTDEENITSLGLKRVYQTTAYMVIIDVAEVLDVNSLAKWLVAGDDAKALYIFRLERQTVDSGLFFQHHRTIFEAARKMIKFSV